MRSMVLVVALALAVLVSAVPFSEAKPHRQGQAVHRAHHAKSVRHVKKHRRHVQGRTNRAKKQNRATTDIAATPQGATST